MTSWYLALHRWVGIWRIVITNVAWKVSVFVVFLVRIFPHSYWIRTRKTPMIYLTVANVFSIHHILFYITNMFIVDGFLQKYFQNRIVCGITFTTTGLSSLASHMSVRLFFVGLKYKDSSMVIQSSYGCQYWVGQSVTTSSPLVLSQAIDTSVWLIILNGGM